jgi:hypothetical protein
MDQSLKIFSLSKQSGIATVSTGVTDVVSEFQSFTSPFNIGSSRTAESSIKREYDDSSLSVVFM